MSRTRELLVPLLLIALLATPVAGQSRREGPDINDSERTLQQKQKQLKEERAKVAQAKKREASVLAELEDTESGSARSAGRWWRSTRGCGRQRPTW